MFKEIARSLLTACTIMITIGLTAVCVVVAIFSMAIGADIGVEVIERVFDVKIISVQGV